MRSHRAAPDADLLPLAEGGEIGAVCRLISVLGHANFMDELAQEYAALTGAAQVTTFILEQQRVRCALASRPREPRLVETLCRSYTRGQFERDPVLPPILQMAPQHGGEFMIRSFILTYIYGERYRNIFFSNADLSENITLISKRGDVSFM